jgi:hypothetical protein
LEDGVGVDDHFADASGDGDVMGFSGLSEAVVEGDQGRVPLACGGLDSGGIEYVSGRRSAIEKS